MNQPAISNSLRRSETMRIDCPTATTDQKRDRAKAEENAKRTRALKQEQGWANVSSAGKIYNDYVAEEDAPEGKDALNEHPYASQETGK
jgi:hypothetical protein